MGLGLPAVHQIQRPGHHDRSFTRARGGQDQVAIVTANHRLLLFTSQRMRFSLSKKISVLLLLLLLKTLA